jgi:hypothetical protein
MEKSGATGKFDHPRSRGRVQLPGVYEALGWDMDSGVDDETDHVAFFQAGGFIVAL